MEKQSPSPVATHTSRSGRRDLTPQATADPMHGGEDAVVTAAGAPARLGAAVIFQREITFLDLEGPVTF